MDIRRRLERGLARWQGKRRGAAVLVSLVDASGKDGSYDVLFERRARSLTTQPGEVCLPGGPLEAGAQPLAHRTVRGGAGPGLVYLSEFRTSFPGT